MVGSVKSSTELIEENQRLQERLTELEATLEAIRSGAVDALVVDSSEGEKIYTLQGAEHPYRIMVETMNEGAATLAEDGTILYANTRLAGILNESLETLIGSSILHYIDPGEAHIFEALIEQGFHRSSRAEIQFSNKSIPNIPILVSISPTFIEQNSVVCLVATDLTEHKRNEEILAAERLARSILDQAAEALIVCDQHGLVIRANQAAHTICHHSPLYHPFSEAFPLIFRDRQGTPSLFSIDKVLQGESFQSLETECAAESDPQRFFLVSAAPLRRRAGETIGAVITLTDISEHKQLEGSLAFQARVLERVRDAIIATDTNLVITSWNRAAEEMYGWTAQEAVGKTASRFFLSDLPAQRRAELLLELKEKGITHFEVTVSNRKGLRMICEVDAITMQDAAGAITGYVSVIRDITARKQAEEAIKSYAQQLEQSNKELLDFAFIASHDLQEPLRKIEAFSKNLADVQTNDDTTQDYLRRLQEATRRMRRMIDDLLELSRVSTRGKPYEPVNLNLVAQTVMEDLEYRIRQVYGQVVVNPLPVIYADPSQMQRLLMNLVGNGLKFTRPGVPPQVEISYRAYATGWCEISVKDNGIGFDMARVEEVFQPFRRLHGRSEYEGSGIGLAICRKIVERHGGRISAESTPGEGSTFRFVLPTRPPSS